MPDHTKREEIRQQVWSRYDRERTRRHESQQVDDKPQPVTVAVTPEHTVDLRENLLERHVLRVHGHNGCLTPQIPQKPLLRKAPPDPSQDPVLDGLNQPNPGFDATTLACLA
jgi:hypothetical protein